MTPPAPPDTSLRDAVTGLYNLKHLVQRLSDLMVRAGREQCEFALILWDIDGFIRFNNDHGQKAGDDFLKNVANLIKRVLRPYDEAFRTGPDEFCVILFPADSSVAEEVMSRVKESVSSGLLTGPSIPSNPQFSISGGVVYYPHEARLPEALVYAAQQELYKAKKK